MSIDANVLRALVAAGATAEMIVAAVEAANATDEAKRAAKRANNAERQRRFKERRKEEHMTKGNADNALPSVTNAIEGELSSSPLDGPLSLPQTPTQSPLNPPTTSLDTGGATADVLPFPKAQVRKSKADRATTLPAGFTLTPERLAFALKEGHTDASARREFSKFTGSAEAHGRKYVNWDRAWENWVRTSIDGFGGARRPSPNGNGSSSGGRFGAMQRALARVAHPDDLPQ